MITVLASKIAKLSTTTVDIQWLLHVSVDVQMFSGSSYIFVYYSYMCTLCLCDSVAIYICQFIVLSNC